MFYKYQMLLSSKIGVFAYAGTRDDKIIGIPKKEFSGEDKFTEVDGDFHILFEKDDKYPRGQKIYHGDSCDKSMLYSGPPDDEVDVDSLRKNIDSTKKLVDKSKLFVD